MTAKGIMNVYPGSPFYITNVNLTEVHVHLPKHQKVGEVADEPVKKVRITNECYWYPSGAHPKNSDSSVSTVYYKSTPDLLEQMEKHEAFNAEHEEKIKNDSSDDV